MRHILLLVIAICSISAAEGRQPNVILVITDDQGYGDLSCHGNPILKTPNLDQLHGESIRLTNYHVDPTCAPTRSALMSGRYSANAAVWHTINGRNMMDSNELTIAEVLDQAGYATAIFGKWHLGDNFPFRPQDQGFDHVAIHGGGGIPQAPDAWRNSYFNGHLFVDGEQVPFTEYCSDEFFNRAMTWIEQHQDQPFFAYISTNAPHGPFTARPEDAAPYLAAGLGDKEANFFGMIANIDDNMARLDAKLAELGLRDDTILIFTTDNGTAAGREIFNAGMKGGKGAPTDGGHRVPFFLRYPAGGLGGGVDVDTLCAHIDIRPTLAELCRATIPADAPADGTSLASLLRDPAAAWPERTLLVESQRIHMPEKWRNNAVMTQRWRLINGQYLFDMDADPGQQHDVAKDNPSVLAELRAAYEAWWQVVSKRHDGVMRIGLGGGENPMRLSSHDWLMPQGGMAVWSQAAVRGMPKEGDKSKKKANGAWAVDVVEAGRYRVELRHWPREESKILEATTARIQLGKQTWEQAVPANVDHTIFEIDLPAGPAMLQTWLEAEGISRGAFYIYVERL
ncbi:MAG: arylsulfatase [Planctomycetota bacterium]|jgi:arylsulfatase A-like enzyme